MNPPNPNTSLLVWLDLEMTDLDPINSHIVEISTIITKSDLSVVAEGPDLVIHHSEKVIDGMSTWCKEHFSESGLIDEIRSSEISLKEAEVKTLEFISKNCMSHTAVLAGSSIHIDREFLRVHMPSIVDYLHYRIIDVNTIKELCHRWYPLTPDYPKIEPHRASDDIYESIEELKYYRTAIFKSKINGH